jgi:hypothetical protein
MACIDGVPLSQEALEDMIADSIGEASSLDV